MGLRRAAHVAWRRVGDETVVVHLRNKKIYVLNPSGGFFWHRLDGTGDTAEMFRGVPLADPVPENASSGLAAFLEQLQEADLVEGGAPIEDEARTTPSPEYPLPSFVPPDIVWQEELRNFGQSCAFIGGQNPACDAVAMM